MGFTGKPHSKNNNTATGIRYDSSVYGSIITSIFGRTRVAPKMIFGGNFRTHKTSSKKGGGKKGGKQTSYSGNFDWLLGYAPIVWAGSLWRNKDNFYPALISSQTFTTSPFTISNNPGPFLGVVSVLATVDISVTFNDYGAPGPVVVSEQEQIPLYPSGQASGQFGNISPGGFDYSTLDRPSYTISSSNNQNISVDSGKGVTVDGSHPVTAFYIYSPTSQPPLSQAGLQFERELGTGNAFGFPGGSAYQVLYPEFSGFSAANLDLGTGNSAPNDNVEVQSLYAYSLSGDANPADVILDVILAGNPALINGATTGFNWNHGLGFGVNNSPQGQAEFPNVLADPPQPPA